VQGDTSDALFNDNNKVNETGFKGPASLFFCDRFRPSVSLLIAPRADRLITVFAIASLFDST
jgi:hypothetical protein